VSGRATAAATLVGVLAGLGLAASVLHARDATYPTPPPTERLLYLRSGKVANRLMLSFDALAADVYWIRAIQHYGRDRKSARDAGRFELLEPLLDLTTTLDPHFRIAYRFGAIFLALPPGGSEARGAGRPDLAVALLEKALRHNPGQWVYANDAGFIHYFFTGNYAEAARWFERAAAMPHAPEWLGPLAAQTQLGAGDRDRAREMLERLTHSEEAYIQRAAQRGLVQLNALDEIDQLQAEVERFFAARHAYPAGWQELLGRFPKDPTGTPYAYDQKTHMVKLSEKSSLSPLPDALTRTPPSARMPR
jgi:tetratricopeptide (TPR) repeat protein